MQDICIKSNCGNAASKSCGSCGGVRYCSSECQKNDWKEVHKNECVDVKKLFAMDLTEIEIKKAVYKMLKVVERLESLGQETRAIDSCEKCVVFAQHHLGDNIPGKQYFILRNGTKVDSELMCVIYQYLVRLYERILRPGLDVANRMFPFVSEARRLLVDRRDAGININNESLYVCDRQLSRICSEQGELDKSVNHYELGLVAARQCKGPDHMRIVFDASINLSRAYGEDGRLPEALSLAEEAYTIASGMYSPVHRLVQEAAVHMIDCLFYMKDYSRAETYCRINYENLMDPIHKNEYNEDDIACGMYRLAHFWLMKEPDDDEIVETTLAEEAEDLIRKLYNLLRTIDNITFPKLYSLCVQDYALILLKRNRLTEETEGILQQYVIHFHKDKIIDYVLYCQSIHNLGMFYKRLSDSLPIGEEKILVREKAELCRMKSCADRSIKHIAENFTRQKITPYFSNNEEIYI